MRRYYNRIKKSFNGKKNSFTKYLSCAFILASAARRHFAHSTISVSSFADDEHKAINAVNMSDKQNTFVEINLMYFFYKCSLDTGSKDKMN